jgi:phage tail sheath protein FI
VKDSDYVGSEAAKTGMYALLDTDIFNILCILPADRAADVPKATLTAAVRLCVLRRAMLVVDPPVDWTTVDTAVTDAADPLVSGDDAKNAAIFFPRVRVADPNKNGALATFPPCGMVAGIWARTDAQRGVWKAPAGTDASLNGVDELQIKLTNAEQGRLNPIGVDCLRDFPIIGPVVWGARTMRGADLLADQWKYIPVRRTALFIEESLYRGTQWVVFEPNDEPLWAAIRLNVGAFMNSLFRQGAFQGRTPKDAYLVKCDAENNPQNDIDRGIVNILVGFAPLKPAEFVLIHIEQLAGQLQV